MTDGIKGENVLVTFWDGSDEYLGFACASSITVNMQCTDIGKSTVGSGNNEESEKVSFGWNFTISGIPYLNQTGYVDLAYMIGLCKSMDDISIMFSASDQSGNQILMTGDVYIMGVSITGSVNNFANATINGKGTGELADVS